MKVVVIMPKLSYKVTGCCFCVHNELGRFHSEPQYADALTKVLRDSGLQFEREKILKGFPDWERPGRSRVDFLIEGRLLLELKAKPFVTKSDYHQVQRYLIALALPLGIIVNFHQRFLVPKRVLNAQARTPSDII